jgi:hypothetical protein
MAKSKPTQIDNRSQLIYALTEVAEFEHVLMCLSVPVRRVHDDDPPDRVPEQETRVPPGRVGPEVKAVANVGGP